MSQLSDFRRKVLKKSQEALSAELGYDKWATYAAQERGENPLPEEVKDRLRGKKYGFQGAWPDEEARESTAPPAMPEEVLKIKGRVEALESQLLAALVASKSLDQRVRELERRLGLTG
jgi:hypothetical protein